VIIVIILISEYFDHVLTNNVLMVATAPTYTLMLKSAGKAKRDLRDNEEYFVRQILRSEAYKTNEQTRVIECKENVAGLALIFVVMAMIRRQESKRLVGFDDELLEDLKGHFEGLVQMRTSTSMPLCVMDEEEGTLFMGEGMALRFLNALIILESLLLSLLDASFSTSQVWAMYSKLDLILHLQLPALLEEILDESERTIYARVLEATNETIPTSKQQHQRQQVRRIAAKLIKSLNSTTTETSKMSTFIEVVPRPKRITTSATNENSNSGIVVLAIIFLLFLGSFLVREFSKIK
jgi:hypothetical protein